MNNKIYIYLDDIRVPFESTYYSSEIIYRDRTINWTIVRNAEEFENLINKIIYNKEWKNIEMISFDNDLGDEYSHLMDNQEEYNKLAETFTEKTGYECAKFLIDKCIDNNLVLPPFLCHSQNPVGNKNILSILNNFKNFK